MLQHDSIIVHPCKGICVKIALTSVFVDDPLKAFKFYTEVLGFVEKLYIPEAAPAIVVSPEQQEGTGLLLEPNNNPIAKTYQDRRFLLCITSHTSAGTTAPRNPRAP